MEKAGDRELLSSFVLSQLALSKRVKAVYEEKMQTMQEKFESRFDKLESVIGSLAIDINKILGALENLEHRKTKINGHSKSAKHRASSSSDLHEAEYDTQIVRSSEKINVATANRNSGSPAKSSESSVIKKEREQPQECSVNPLKVTADLVILRENGKEDKCLQHSKSAEGRGDYEAIPSARPSGKTESALVYRKPKKENHLHLASFVEREESSEDEDDEGKGRCCATKNALAVFRDCTLQNFLRNVFGISKPDHSVNHPGSRAIHPGSPFMAGQDLLRHSRSEPIKRDRRRMESEAGSKPVNER